jgi:hypothetical protein
MSEDFPQLPDMGAMLAQRIAAKKADATGAQPAPGTFDPYQAMLDRKAGKPIEQKIPEVQQWPEEDVQKLQDYCKKMGIVGFNSGRMHPIAALAMLMKQFGEDYSNVPLEERVPQGYEKIGTKSQHGPNYPYSAAMKQKQILHG